ncbi:MAG: PIN domain-containing protein [Candidatus Thermoplasmatota archaeon]|nr:PIN domain-containing protein [Candidatus Thermoplasmatota archaeon]
MIIPDTNYLIDVLSNEDNAMEKSKQLQEEGVPQKLCTPVVYEVMAGIEFVGSKKEKIKIDSLVRKFPVLTFDLHAAEICSEIDAELRKEGEKCSPVDLQIASIALANNERLLTNDDDFTVMKDVFDLRLERY